MALAFVRAADPSSRPSSFSNQKSIMLSVAKLDFGDCYTSVPVYQILTVKNVTEDTMEVFFDSDASHEVSFDLITENDQQENERQRTAADEAYDSDSNSSSDSEADTADTNGTRSFAPCPLLSFSLPACARAAAVSSIHPRSTI